MPDPYLDALDRVQQQARAAEWPIQPPPKPNSTATTSDDPWLATLDAVQQPVVDPRSGFSRAYDAAFTAPEFVTRGASKAADWVDSPALDRSRLGAQVRGFVGGAIEGAASLLTPGDVALTAVGFGPLARAAKAVRGGAKAVEALQRVANLATAARGVERVADARSLPEASAGVAQVVLGGIGARGTAHEPAAPPRIAGELPPGPRFTVVPDGRVAPAGTDIPMTAAPDGTFTRSTPAASYFDENGRQVFVGDPTAANIPRPVRGALPAGRTVRPMPGDVLPEPTPGGRGVPAASYYEDGRQVFVGDPNAASQPRPVRGQLPGGRARFVAGEHGPAVPVEQADEWLRTLDVVQGHTPAEPSGRLVPAAVVSREIDTTRPTAEVARVSQYSSDANAVDAPLIADDELHMLTRMRTDLETFAPQRGRLIRDPLDPNSSIYAHGGPGSPVGDDVRVISGQHVGNDRIAAAIDDLIAGKSPSNKLHWGALDAARGYLEGRAGYRGPYLPVEVADEGARAAGTAPAVAGAGGHPAAVDDFEQFSKIFDEFGSGGSGEPGERGAATPAFLAHLGGAAGGAALGVVSGETTEDKIKRGLLYGAAGAVAPALLRRESAGLTSRAASSAAEPRLAPSVVADAVGRIPRTGRSGDPMRDPLAGFEPFFAKFSNPLVRDGVAKVVRDNGGFEVQRRGTIPTRQLGQFANEVRVNVERVLPKGAALSAEGITAYARALQETTRKVNELATKVHAGNATDAELLAFQVAQAEQQTVATSMAGARSEAGRALAAFNFWGGILDTGDVNLIRNAVTPLREEAAKIAKGLAALPDDPLTRYRWLKSQSEQPWSSHLRSYYLSNLLSGPLTHARNILGNVANATFDIATAPIAAGIDAAKSAVRGTPRSVRLSEMPASMSGAIVGVEKGFQDGLFALRHGIHPAALTRSVEAAASHGKLDLPPAELPGGGFNPFNWPFRALNAPDAFFRSIAHESELSAILFNQAKNEGLKGQGLLDRVAVLRGSMDPEAIALRNQAEEYASRRVFLEKPGDITNRVVALAHAIPGSYFVMPFVRITSSIVRQGAQFSPVGFLMKAAREGGRVGTQAQARATAGSLAAGYLFWLASSGRLSGNGPTDPATRTALQEAGWKPNAVKIGDRWYQYQAASPLNVPAAAIANGVEAWRERGEKPGEVADVLSQVFARTANSFLDSTFLEGTFNLVEALKDPERNAARFFGRTVAGLIPASSALRTAQRVTDPTIRQSRTFTENLKSGIPGISEDIEPRIDRFGKPVIREGGPVQRALDPFNSSTVVHDPLAEELDRLNVKLTLPSGKANVKGQPALTREQETALKSAKGQEVRRELEQVMSSPRYEQMDDPQRKAAMDRIIDRARIRAGDTFKAGVRRSNEQEFRQWYADVAKRFQLDSNPNHPSHFYDWRAAWRNHAEADDAGHWPSEYKQLGHPNLIVGGVDTRNGQQATDALRRASETRRMRIERQVTHER